MKRALIFSGGGSRGAYEVGAWQAFDELGVRFHAVYGTSIGALNAVLFAQGDLDRAVKLWSNITVKQVIATDREDLSIDRLATRLNDIVPFLVENARYLQADITPLEKLIDESIDENRIRCSGLELGIMTTTVPQLQPKAVRLRDMKPGTLRDWVIASASAFPVFPIREVGGGRYVDGGFCDNLPLDMALEDGADELVAVDVHPVPVHAEYGHAPFLRVIHPLHNLGGFLDFAPKLLRRTRLMGYYDTLKKYSALDGIRYSFPFRAEQTVAGKASRYALAAAKLDAAALKPRRGGEDAPPPFLTALGAETPGRSLTYKETYLRGLELCAECLGFREDAIYEPERLTKQILDFVRRGEAQPLNENALRAREKDPRETLTFLYNASAEELTANARILKTCPKPAAAALWLKCEDGTM